jgi:hypothetical protein
MPRSMVGLLAAVGTFMSSLTAFSHGNLVWLAVLDAAVATGLAAYLALPGNKKNPLTYRTVCRTYRAVCCAYR